MGIQGLLPFLKKIHKPVNISQFHGCTVAIDAYCWLHKGAFSCAEKLAMREDTDQYVIYCMKYINYMLSKDIKPIMVFDGCHLESKAGVEKTRRENRELNRKKAAQFLREGKRSEARDCLQKCIDVTPQMALKLISTCRDRGVDCIVAPYEADAQLAYLNLSGIAQVIVTEDSDLLLFGCDNIIFKMDFFGNGALIEQSRLNEVLALQSGFYTFEKFRYMCILSGCDYLPSLRGIGLAKSNKVFKLARQGDIRQLLKKIPTYLKMNVEVTDDYVEGFVRADNTFLYQLVFDPLNRVLKPLNPYPPEFQGVDLSYAGHHIPRQMAYQIALGNIDIHTHQAIADFDPDTFVAKHPIKAKYRYQLSIWDKNYAVKSGSPCKEIQPSSLLDTDNKNSIIAKGRHAPKTKHIKLSQESDGHQSSVLKMCDVLDVYDTKDISTKKVAKKRMFEDLDDFNDQEEENVKRRHDSSSNSSCLDDMVSNDENNRFSPIKCSPAKRSPAKRSKVKYDASNIGENAFLEGSVPLSKDANKTSCNNRPSRNIFAVTKAVKCTPNISTSVETKSKYFPSASPVADDKSECNVPSMDTNRTLSSPTENSSNKRTSVSKRETPKPLSLTEMFKNLKEKKILQGDKPTDKTEKVENSPSTDANQQSFKRTPSAFSWSKFKCNSSSSVDSKKKVKSQSDSSSAGSKNFTQDSFSELLSSTDNQSSPTESPSLLSTSTSNAKKVSNLSSYFYRKPQCQPDSKNSISTNDKHFTVLKQSNSLTAPGSEVQELTSQSYKNFLQSMQLDREVPKDSCEAPEIELSQCEYEEESPFPETDKNSKETKVVDVNVVNIDIDDTPDYFSQESVVDLTLDASQTSNASVASRSSNTSGLAKCRVSGLSKRKGRGKKPDVSKSDTSQKSITDLFSKFAFKKKNEPKSTVDSEPRPTAIATSYSIESLDESEDEDMSETPLSPSYNIDTAAVVRRKLML